MEDLLRKLEVETRGLATTLALHAAISGTP